MTASCCLKNWGSSWVEQRRGMDAPITLSDSSGPSPLHLVYSKPHVYHSLAGCRMTRGRFYLCTFCVFLFYLKYSVKGVTLLRMSLRTLHWCSGGPWSWSLIFPALSSRHAIELHFPTLVNLGGAMWLVLAHDSGAKVACVLSGWTFQLPVGDPPESSRFPSGRGRGHIWDGSAVILVSADW